MQKRTFQGVERLAYSPLELAYATGLGRSSVYELIRRGDISVVRVGKRILIPREAAERLLRERVGRQNA